MTTIERPNLTKIHMCVDRLSPMDAARLKVKYDNRGNVTDKELSRFQIALITAKRWENGSRLRCKFLEPASVVSDSIKQRVIDKARIWESVVNVGFDFIESGDSDIRISFLQQGSWSALGTDARGFAADKPTMNYGWLDEGTIDEEYERVVLHEFGHALGCIHEHQSPEGGVPWNPTAVYTYYSGEPNNWTPEEIDRNVLYRYSTTVAKATAFDPLSIMMYDIKPELTVGGWSASGGKTLTNSDRDFMTRMYPTAPIEKRALMVGAAPISADIKQPGEEDQYTFTVSATGTYAIETSGTTDLVMRLYGPNDHRQVVAEDDDSGSWPNPRIQRELLPGSYLASVFHFDKKETGEYQISLSKI